MKEENQSSATNTTYTTTMNPQYLQDIKKQAENDELEGIIDLFLGATPNLSPIEFRERNAWILDFTKACMAAYAKKKMKPLQERIEYLEETQQRILNVLGVSDEYGN